MSDEGHERIAEILAGYVLGALDGGAPDEAEHLLAEHVPACLSCRATLRDLHAVVGELGLATAPVEPPDVLGARIRRSADDGSRRRPVSRARLLLAAAAGALLVLGLGTTSVLLAGQVSRAEAFQEAMAEGFRTLADPASEQVDMADAPATRLYVTYVPGSDRMVLMGLNVPAPADGDVYRLWGVRGGTFRLLAEFLPDDDGLVAVRLDGTPERFDRLICASERGSPGTRPGEARWIAPVAWSPG